MDLTATRRRLMMPDPNDPLDPANIDKMLEDRRKSRLGASDEENNYENFLLEGEPDDQLDII